MDYVNFISKGLYQLIESIIKEYSRPLTDGETRVLGQVITKYFVRCVEALALYLIILDQLKKEFY
jgi:hypothetical protein